MGARRISPAYAVSAALEAGFDPHVPYPGNHDPWLATLPCGHKKHIRYDVNVCQKSVPQCVICYEHDVRDAVEAKGWSLVDIVSSQRVAIRCPSGHERYTQVAPLKTNNVLWCEECRRAEAQHHAQRLGVSLAEYRSTADIDIACAGGHHRRVEIGKLRKVQRMNCTQCFEREAREHAARHGMTLVQYVSSKIIDLRCLHGHEHTSKLGILRNAKRIYCTACLTDEARELVISRGWAFVRYVNNAEIITRCPEGHERANQLASLRKNLSLVCLDCRKQAA